MQAGHQKIYTKISLNDVHHGVIYIRSNHMKLPFLRSRIAKCQEFHIVHFNNVREKKKKETHKCPLIGKFGCISVPTLILHNCSK